MKRWCFPIDFLYFLCLNIFHGNTPFFDLPLPFNSSKSIAFSPTERNCFLQ